LKFRNPFKASPANTQAQLEEQTKLKRPISSLGHQLSFDHVFIITYGRSGSTLLQGLLNAIEGVLVRGENGNFVFNLFEAYEAIVLAKEKHPNVTTNTAKPWYGLHEIDLDAIIKDLRKIVLRALMSDQEQDDSIQCVGFKEIRYPTTDEKLEGYLDFLSMLFPKSAFIFLRRDLDQVQRSAWWRFKDPEWVRSYLGAFEERVQKYATGRSDYYTIHYDDIVETNETLKGMYTFLGAPYIEADVLETLSTPHSYVPATPK
jgi:hypothetical protein